MSREPLTHIPGRDNLPPNLSLDERSAAVDPGLPAAKVIPMPDSLLPSPSPTGTPIVKPGTIGFRVLGLVMACLAAVAVGQPDLFPSTELDQQVAVIVMAVIGFVSPGLRRQA